jgi:hypothetical protein
MTEAEAHAVRLGRALAHQPRSAGAKERRLIHDRLRRLSRSLGTPMHQVDQALTLNEWNCSTRSNELAPESMEGG